LGRSGERARRTRGIEESGKRKMLRRRYLCFFSLTNGSQLSRSYVVGVIVVVGGQI
jgi:hypothetical protein